MEVITTKKINLIEATDSQMEELVQNQSDPEMKQAYQEMLDGCIKHPEQHKWYAVWFIEKRDGARERVGDLCFKGITEDGMVEIGYGVYPEFEGQGYATEAVSAMCAFAAVQPEVSRIEAETLCDNFPSQRVLEKCGFVPTGSSGEEGPRFVLKF